jgi:nifR3 family TIM-barrel protein
VYIRDVHVDPPLVLAPMEGVTDVVFRRLIRSIGGCGLTVTEFVPGASLAQGHARALRTIQVDPDEHPVSIQLYGRDPELLAEGARVAEGAGATIVDLNMGCPSKKVCAHSGGSALLKEPDLARRIVRAVRAATTLPFTVKVRSGWDPEHRNAPDIAAMCEDEGVEMIAVHWRTKADLFGGVRDLSTIAAVKRRVSIPVLANGDVVDAESARHTLAETGADALMIGRGAVRDPWVFRRIERALRGGPPLEVDLADRERLLVGFYATIRETFDNEKATLGRMKKIAKYAGDGIEGGDALRQAIWHAATTDEVFRAIEDFFQTRRVAA